MNVARFVRSLERGQARIVRREKNLAANYERIIRKAAGTAARALVADHGLTAAAQPDWQPPPEGVLFTPVGITVALKREQARAAETAIRPALEREGIAWNTDDPLLQDLLAQTGAWSGDAIGDAFQPELRKIVADAFADGLSVKDAAALIRSRFAETAPWQAEMLARSNLNMLGNGGMHVAVTRYNAIARATGDKTIETKTWLTAGDSAVRPTHVAAEGQTVPVDQDFQVGGSSLPFPGSPSGALKEILNCRCTTLYGTRARNSLTASVRSTGMRQRATRTGDAQTAAAVTVTVDDAPADAAAEVAWVSDIAFENEATDDGRFMLADAIEWRDLPLPLMILSETGPGGHQGAVLGGKILLIVKDSEFDMDGERLPEGVTAIRAHGIFDVAGENGLEAARVVGDEFMRGVSLDPAGVEAVLRDPETGETWSVSDADEEVLQRAMFGELQTAFKRYIVGGATVCPTPAFANARIAVVASGAHLPIITTTFELESDALVAAAAPVAPPRDWFFMPEPSQPTPLTITDDGRVFGHIAMWGACHAGRPGQCFQPPSSPSGYAYFNATSIPCKDGENVDCGQLTIGTDHAPLAMSWREVKAHYEDTGRCIADVRAVDGVHGIFVAGALRPHVTDAERRELCGSKPSGHWCSITPGGPLEMVGVLEVNIPGFPVPRPQLALAASAAHPDGEPVALIAAGIVGEDDFDRRLDVHMARLGGVDALAELIG